MLIVPALMITGSAGWLCAFAAAAGAGVAAFSCAIASGAANANAMRKVVFFTNSPCFPISGTHCETRGGRWAFRGAGEREAATGERGGSGGRPRFDVSDLL